MAVRSDLLLLASGRHRLSLAPQIGGAIADWSCDGVPLLRPSSEDDLASGEASRLGSYPLVPYSNRINSGRFRFEGIDHQLALNFGDRPHSIHGIGWQRSWTVASADASRAHLLLEHDARGDGANAWPFSFHAEQLFELAAEGLTATISVENRDRRNMPAGLGLHPYFPRTSDVELQFAASSVWPNGADYLPTGRSEVPARWSYAAQRPLGEPGLDNCFAGWSHQARIVWPQRRLTLEIDADPLFSHLVVFTPAGQSFFAVEPVSNMNDGINRMATVADHGIAVLAPGERLSGTVRFKVQ